MCKLFNRSSRSIPDLHERASCYNPPPSGTAESQVACSVDTLFPRQYRQHPLVSSHAHDRDAGDLALDVEAEQKAGRITAREDQLYFVECLVVYRTLLHATH